MSKVMGLREQVTRLEEEVATKTQEIRTIVANSVTASSMTFDPAVALLREEILGGGCPPHSQSSWTNSYPGRGGGGEWTTWSPVHPTPLPSSNTPYSRSGSGPRPPEPSWFMGEGGGGGGGGPPPTQPDGGGGGMMEAQVQPPSLVLVSQPALYPINQGHNWTQPLPSNSVLDQSSVQAESQLNSTNLHLDPDPDFDPNNSSQSMEAASSEEEEAPPPPPPGKRKRVRKRERKRKEEDSRYGKLSEAERISRLAKRNETEVETFSPVITTEDGRRFYDSHEILSVPGGGGTLECGTCGWRETNDGTRNWLRIRSIKTHIKGVHQNAYKCSKCSINFTSHKQLREHVCGRVGLRKRQTFKCGGCLKSFLFRPSLMSHRKICEAEAGGGGQIKGQPNNTKVNCGICGRPVHYTYMRAHLVTHMNSEEKAEAAAAGKLPKDKPLTNVWGKGQEQCPTCGKMITRAYFNHHLDIHKGEEEREKRFHCPVDGCGAWFPNTKFLAKHKMKKHPPPRIPVICPDPGCKGKSFPSSIHLRFHRRRMHPTDKDKADGVVFTCPICHGRQYHESVHNQHISAHRKGGQTAEDYKVLCPVDGCGQRCITTTALTRHQNWWHPELGKKDKKKDSNAPKKVKPLSKRAIAEMKRKMKEKKPKKAKKRAQPEQREELGPFVKLEGGGGWQLEFLGFTVFSGTDGYTCESCGLEFNFDLDPLEDHDEKETKRKREQVAKDVKRHIKAVHRKDYKCDVCDKVMSSHATLLTHRRHCISKMPIPCPICECCLIPAEMEIHRWTHRNIEDAVVAINSGENVPISLLGKPNHPVIYLEQDEVPIKCDHCGGEGTTPAHLYKHILKKHPEIYSEKRIRIQKRSGGRKKKTLEYSSSESDNESEEAEIKYEESESN